MSWDLLLVNPALLHVSNLLLSFHCFWNFHAHGYYSYYKESLVPLCCLKIAFIRKMNNYSKVTRGSKRKLQKINNIKEAPLQFINEKTVFPEWILCALGFPGDSVLKDLPANAGVAGNAGLIPGSGTSPGGENGNLLQDCCLENLGDRGSWRATVHGVAKSQTQLRDWADTQALSVLYVWGWGWGAQTWVTYFQHCPNLNNEFKQILKIQTGDLNWKKKSIKNATRMWGYNYPDS